MEISKQMSWYSQHIRKDQRPSVEHTLFSMASPLNEFITHLIFFGKNEMKKNFKLKNFFFVIGIFFLFARAASCVGIRKENLNEDDGNLESSALGVKINYWHFCASTVFRNGTSRIKKEKVFFHDAIIWMWKIAISPLLREDFFLS